MKRRIPCPLCPERFGSAVALDYHVRETHPGAREAARKTINLAYKERDRERAEGAEERARKRLDQYYRDGCACGRTYAQHQAAREAVPIGRNP